MKRTAGLLSAITTVLSISMVSAWGATGGAGQPGTGQRDECLLVARLSSVGCTNHIDSIDNRIERLQSDIAKGSAVYSQGELAYLKKELKQYQSMHEYLQGNAPYGGY